MEETKNKIYVAVWQNDDADNGYNLFSTREKGMKWLCDVLEEHKKTYDFTEEERINVEKGNNVISLEYEYTEGYPTMVYWGEVREREIDVISD